MNFIYFDAASGLSGDMILGALLDLGIDHQSFADAISCLNLPVEINIHETKRSSIRGLKVDIKVLKEERLIRRWADIEELIQSSSFNKEVKSLSLKIFRLLFEAEAKVHGHDFHKTHLHEAGADDAIVDILGTAFLINQLDITSFYASPLNVGQGWINCSHGKFPVPPPAVAELLANVPVFSSGPKEEMVTPTGAAIITGLVQEFIPFPEMTYDRIGWGAGTRDFKDSPNLLRVFYGPKKNLNDQKNIYQIEVNIDDANPQLLASFIDKALSLGALDAFMTPVYMKKNRLGTKLTILSEWSNLDLVSRTIFEETTSIGIRYFPVSRRVLERHIKKVIVLGEEISLKIAEMDGKDINIQPEYEDCNKVAKKKNIPVKKVMELVLQAYQKEKNG